MAPETVTEKPTKWLVFAHIKIFPIQKYQTTLFSNKDLYIMVFRVMTYTTTENRKQSHCALEKLTSPDWFCLSVINNNLYIIIYNRLL